MKIKASAKIDTQDIHHNTVYGSKKPEKPKCTRVKDQLKKKNKFQDFPGNPVVKTVLPMQGA